MDTFIEMTLDIGSHNVGQRYHFWIRVQRNFAARAAFRFPHAWSNLSKSWEQQIQEQSIISNQE
jgi:hypothetical protein